MCKSAHDNYLKCRILLEILQFKIVFALKFLKSDLGVIKGEFFQLLDSCFKKCYEFKVSGFLLKQLHYSFSLSQLNAV